MTEAANDISSFIRGLSDADPAKRGSAAAEIFRRGSELARSAVQHWLADKELAGCFTIGDSGFPETTVGLAVMPARFESIRTACGSPRLADAPPDEDVLEVELEFPAGVRLDILTSRQPEGSGAIARFLRRFGEGIQQIELFSNNVDRATRILRERFRLMPVFPATRAGAGGTRVNFFLVREPQGRNVLIELVEAGKPHA